ncbi:MAG: hypothetical protein K2R98_05330 [Gemmataceae bacterium]|nr:hypothetical protein [Gemmataceae bacterium]
MGKFGKELTVPGRDSLLVAPEDWPKTLAPGTLNVLISHEGFPRDFDSLGAGDRLKKFDEGKFRPAFVIPQRLIAGNTLKPRPDQPTRGFAQVWRAELQVVSTCAKAKCWMLRRIGSSIAAQIELVAEDHLRSRLNLFDGAEVKVTVFEAEPAKLPTPDAILTNQCEAARGILDEFGTEKALGYLIGEKFLNFLEVAETDQDFRAAIPAFVAEIKDIFDSYQLADFFGTPRRLGALGHASSEEGHKLLRDQLDDDMRLREDARNLTLFEWARELLLDE